MVDLRNTSTVYLFEYRSKSHFFVSENQSKDKGIISQIQFVVGEWIIILFVFSTKIN